jgi:hypothetical protein
VNSVELIRQLIRQQTNLIGQPVTNLLGGVAELGQALLATKNSQWRVARIPGSRLPTLDEFYAIYIASTDRITYVANTTTGVVVCGAGFRVVGDVLFEPTEVATYLLLGTIEVPASQSIPVTIESGESGSGEFGLYVDGTLIRRGYGRLQTSVALSAGRHVLQIIGTAQVFGVALPDSILVTTSSENLQIPIWNSLTSAYIDEAAGTTSVTLSWFNALNAGGWRILRSQRQELGALTSIGSPNSSGEFGVEITGSWLSTIQSAGSQLFAGSELMGTILQVEYDSTLNITSAVVRLVSGRGVVNSFWLNRIASVGQLAELTRIKRTTSTPTITWDDSTVKVGDPYEYGIQAFGLFDETILSGISTLKYIRAGDVTPPASIAFAIGYPKSLNKRATVKFITPADEDYDGVRVYYKLIPTSGVATSGGSTTLTDTGKVWTINAYTNLFVKITSGTGAGQIRQIVSNTSNQLTISVAWAVNPNATSAYQVYQFNKVMTDYGVPNAADELMFEPTADGAYYFVTFDKAGNEQWFDDALIWNYVAATDDTFLGANLSPILGIEQLTTLAQQALSAPYNDTLNYAVIKVSASDPVDGLTGVTIQYKRRQDAAFVTGLSASASAVVIDNPAGTRGRLIPVSRGENVNWIQIKAVDATSLESDLLTFVPDYDDNPEISSIDSRIDSVLNRVVTTLAVDDDTFSVEWWLDGADFGEPTFSARNKTLFNMQTTKNVTFIFSLTDGERKILHVLPYAGLNQTGGVGEEYTREFARPPRTTIIIDDIDANNVHRADQVKITFRVAPSTFGIEETGTATSGDSNHLFDTSADFMSALVGLGQLGKLQLGRYWEVNRFAEVGQRVFFVRIDSGTGAGQCRRIKTNTATSLEVVPSWVTVPDATSKYTIQRGGTQYRLNGIGEFIGIYPELPETSPTPFDHLFLSRDDIDMAIEYYTVITDVPPEPILRAIVDADTTPEIGTLTLSEYIANQIRVVIAGVDDDAKRWRVYSKKGTGAWPTGPGTSTGDPLDETYLRFDGPISQLNFDMAAGSGDWNVIVVPINSYGDFGPRLTSTKAISGVGDSDPQLSALTVTAHDNGSTAYYNMLAWNHNTIITDSSVIHQVKIYAYRDDLGIGTEIELTNGVTRRPWMDVGANYINSDDINESGQNGKGSYLHQTEVRTTAGTPGAVSRRWRYRVQLYESGVLKFTYYTENTDYYIPTAPTFSGGATVAETNTGSCTNPGSGWVQVNHENQVSWLLTGGGLVNTADFQVDIDLAPDGSTFSPVETGVSIASTQRYFQDAVINGPPNDFAKSWTYKVKLIRKGDSSLIDSKTTSALNRNCYNTCPIPIPAPGSFNVFPGEGLLGNNHRVEIDVQPTINSTAYPGAVMDLERAFDQGGGSFSAFILVTTFNIDSVGTVIAYNDNATNAAVCGIVYKYRCRQRATGMADGPYTPESSQVTACSG